MNTLRVAELFGPTAQGEGPHVGHVSAFLRLSGCNLTCSWCDTPYTWDWTRFDRTLESRAEDVDKLVDALNSMAVERIILTGGEPLIQQNKLPPLLAQLDHPVDVETNGTIGPSDTLADLVDLFVVSPKVMPSAEQPFRSASRARTLARFSELAQDDLAVFKYVARDMTDLLAIEEHVAEHRLAPVYVMPEGRNATAILDATRAIADAVVARGWRLSTRLHVLAWGDERGR